MKIKTTVAALAALVGLLAVPSAHAQSAPELKAQPLVVGHRGASGTRPEETFASYDHAVELGVDYIEGDLQLTSDGVLVMMHDTTLNRTARGDAASCTGPVDQHTLAQVKTCDVGSWFSPDYAGQRIVTLEELFQRYGRTVNYYIETKAPDTADHMEERLIALMDKYDMRQPSIDRWQVLLQSFSSASLVKLHAIDPRLPLVFLGNPSAAQLPAVAQYAVGVGPSDSGTFVSKAWVDAAHTLCMDVHPYTVNDPAAMQRLLDNGVDGMFTNYADRLEAILGDRKAQGLQGGLDAKLSHDACVARHAAGTVGGTVGSLLSLTVGGAPSFGTFTPGLAFDYVATSTVSVDSTAQSATLTVSDPSSTATGHLVNGTYSLAQPLQVKAQSGLGTGGAFAPLPSAALSYSQPVSNDAVTLAFKQSIGATEGLRTGGYAKTLTFTLSTTSP
jgi:glycerophosphoryl diester phosphodiesterase